MHINSFFFRSITYNYAKDNQYDNTYYWLTSFTSDEFLLYDCPAGQSNCCFPNIHSLTCLCFQVLFLQNNCTPCVIIIIILLLHPPGVIKPQRFGSWFYFCFHVKGGQILICWTPWSSEPQTQTTTSLKIPGVKPVGSDSHLWQTAHNCYTGPERIFFNQNPSAKDKNQAYLSKIQL